MGINNFQNISKKAAAKLFWDLCACGPKIKLLESVMDLGLVEYIMPNHSRTADEIIQFLKLDKKRGEKWLQLLSGEGFLAQDANEKNQTYQLGPILKVLSQTQDTWNFYRGMIGCWTSVNIENFSDVLRGAPVRNALHWPPVSVIDSTNTENLMAYSALPVINLLKKTLHFNEIQRMLDVGGGDGTMACNFAHAYPQLHVTVYNIEQSALQAQNKIKTEQLSDRVTTYIGDFIKDRDLPSGFDVVLFSRVLCDWPEEICIKLLKMAYKALNDGGSVIICEPFKDENKTLALTWEFLYIFWDDFGQGVFKYIGQYEKILRDIGFDMCISFKENEDSVHWVLKATKGKKAPSDVHF